MEKSQSIMELAKALVEFQSEMKPIGFDANNPFYKSKYTTLSALVKDASPILTKNGLAITQLTEGNGSVTTMLMHKSGEYILSSLCLKPIKEDPQGQGSAITYARRYSYASILGLISDEDDDGNAASHVLSGKPNVSMPQEKAPVAETKPVNQAKNPISEPQSKRLYAIRKSVGYPDDKFNEWLLFNFNTDDRNIDRKDYEAIVSHVQGYKNV